MFKPDERLGLPREGLVLEGEVMIDAESRRKLIAQLGAERDELERKAAQCEKRAQRLKEGQQKSSAQLEARNLRRQAREAGRRWADLTEDELRDHDRS